MDIFSFTPVSLVKAVQKQEMKSLSRSQMMLLGSPFSQYQLLKNSTARSSAVMFKFVGTIRTLAPMRSVIDRMQLKPESMGKGPMKSIAMDVPR